MTKTPPPKRRPKNKPRSKTGDTKQGRPPEFYEEYILQVRHIAALGAKESEIAKVFNVTGKTIRKWCHKYPAFGAAIKEGRQDPDNRVEASLFRRALKGDVTACIFWLKCRRPYIWRDRRAEDAPAGDEIKQRFANMTTAQLRKIIQGTSKMPNAVVEVPALANGNGNGKL